MSVKYPDKKEPVLITGPQANGVMEYVLRRRVSSTNDALETIFKKVEEAQDISKSNGNGHKPRKPRVLKNREPSVRIMEKSARARWALKRGEIELAKKYEMEAEELKASRTRSKYHRKFSSPENCYTANQKPASPQAPS